MGVLGCGTHLTTKDTLFRSLRSRSMSVRFARRSVISACARKRAVNSCTTGRLCHNSCFLICTIMHASSLLSSFPCIQRGSGFVDRVAGHQSPISLNIELHNRSIKEYRCYNFKHSDNEYHERQVLSPVTRMVTGIVTIRAACPQPPGVFVTAHVFTSGLPIVSQQGSERTRVARVSGVTRRLCLLSPR
jgi:hypothetical protein